MNKQLTRRQCRFVDELFVDYNATQAAIRAGYSARTASQIAYELLQKTSVARAVAARQGERLARLEATAEDVLLELKLIAFFDPGELFWKTGELDSEDRPTVPNTLKPLHELLPHVRRMLKVRTSSNGRYHLSTPDRFFALKILAIHYGLAGELPRGAERRSLAARLRDAKRRTSGLPELPGPER